MKGRWSKENLSRLIIKPNESDANSIGEIVPVTAEWLENNMPNRAFSEFRSIPKSPRKEDRVKILQEDFELVLAYKTNKETYQDIVERFVKARPRYFDISACDLAHEYARKIEIISEFLFQLEAKVNPSEAYKDFRDALKDKFYEMIGEKYFEQDCLLYLDERRKGVQPKLKNFSRAFHFEKTRKGIEGSVFAEVNMSVESSFSCSSVPAIAVSQVEGPVSPRAKIYYLSAGSENSPVLVLTFFGKSAPNDKQQPSSSAAMDGHSK